VLGVRGESRHHRTPKPETRTPFCVARGKESCQQTGAVLPNNKGSLRHSTIRLGWSIAVLTLAHTGCGSEFGPTGTVRGTVQLDEKPLPLVNVEFRDLVTGHGGIGPTDDEGNYSITNRFDGKLPVGQYQVIVTPAAPVLTQEYSDNLDPNAPSIYVERTFPEKYTIAFESGLSFEIVEGENTYDIEMTE